MKRWILLSILAGSLTGCIGEENSDLKAWMAEQSEGLRGRVEPLPEVKAYEPFAYDAFGLPDPFKPSKMELAKKGIGSGIAPNRDRVKEVLENYDLEKLRMVGTLQQGKTVHALIKAPDGNLYRVKVGSYMGQDFGMVMAVNETEITLKEIVEDSGGDWVERTTTLGLDDSEQKK
ncbi:pilus assembly protein PilP [Chitinibacter sp. GC72]|uniref:pilus assembly protein PilP n=1 Tax=Chitinibacter sp. GC72 TaxID=1526917 RepID=UPI0012FAA780|nr:pilus assembly protein PilP [Chitinibacter sp. GC72]